MTELAKDIGLEQDIVTNTTGQSYIFAKNKLYPIPGGSIMGIPTDIKPFVTTKLISPLGKLRAGLDLIKSLYKCKMVTFLLVHFQSKIR